VTQVAHDRTEEWTWPGREAVAFSDYVSPSTEEGGDRQLQGTVGIESSLCCAN